MFKALIFDMDGVIIDSEPFHYIVNQDLFHQLGMDVSETDYRSYIGTSHTHMWTDLKGKHHLTLSVEALVDMQVKGNEAYLLNHEFLPFPGSSRYWIRCSSIWSVSGWHHPLPWRPSNSSCQSSD